MTARGGQSWSKPDDWFPTDAPVCREELLALTFLNSGGPHQIGVIDTEETFAAAFVFMSLVKRGMVLASINSDGPTYHLTGKGLLALNGGS